MTSYTGITRTGRISIGMDNPQKGTSQRGWHFKVNQSITVTGLRIITGTIDMHNIVTIYNLKTGQQLVKGIVDSTSPSWNESDLKEPVTLVPGDYVISAYVWDRGPNAYANLHQEGPNDYSQIDFNNQAIEFVCPICQDFPIQGYDIYPYIGVPSTIFNQHIYQNFSSEDVDAVLALVPIVMPTESALYLSGIPDFVYEFPAQVNPIPSTPQI